MPVLFYTDAAGEDLVQTTRAALPDADTFLVLLHLRLMRSPAGRAIVDMLGEAPRTCLIGEQLLRYQHADGTEDTSVMLGVTTTPPATPGPVILGEIDPQYWLHIWPSDRPLPTEDTAVVWVHVNALED